MQEEKEDGEVDDEPESKSVGLAAPQTAAASPVTTAEELVAEVAVAPPKKKKSKWAEDDSDEDEVRELTFHLPYYVFISDLYMALCTSAGCASCLECPHLDTQASSSTTRRSFCPLHPSNCNTPDDITSCILVGSACHNLNLMTVVMSCLMHGAFLSPAKRPQAQLLISSGRRACQNHS